MATERLVYVATVGTNIVVDPAPLDAETLDQRTAELTDPISYGLYSQKTQGKQFPDVLYLLCTNVPPPGSEGTAENLKQKWRALIPSIVLRTIPAFDLDGAATAVSAIAQKERGAQITVNYSSGTNPMQAGTLTRAVDHVLLGDVAQIVYVQEFRDRRKEGKGTFDTMELKRVEPLRLYYARLFETALRLYKQFSYEQAQAYFEQARQVAPTDDDRKRAQGYKELCEIWLLWDAFSYSSLTGRLKTAAQLLKEDTSLSEELFQKAKYLEEHVLKHKARSLLFFHVIDMLENSVRELCRGRKHECLLKLYRFYELLFRWRLAKVYDFFAAKQSEELTRVWPQIIEMWAIKKKLKSKKDAEEELEKIRRGEEDFYGREMEWILDHIKDRTFLNLQEGLLSVKMTLGDLRALRNGSPYIHGFETGQVRKVKDKTLHGMIQLGYTLLQDLTGRPQIQSRQETKTRGLESLRTLSRVPDVPSEELAMLQELTRPFFYDPFSFLKA